LFKQEKNEHFFDSFRIQISLGSTIDKIFNISEHGFIVQYKNGDICNRTTGQTYSSQINYKCYMGPNWDSDNSFNENIDVKKPEFQLYD
jgi:hypothetical protein